MEKDLYYEEKFKNIHSRLNDHEDRISANENKIIATDKDLAIAMQGINTSLEALSGLPNVISGMNETIIKTNGAMDLMQAELRRNTEEITAVKNDIADNRNKIKKVDEKSKIDIWTFITKHWWKFLLGGGGVFGVVEYILSRSNG